MFPRHQSFPFDAGDTHTHFLCFQQILNPAGDEARYRLADPRIGNAALPRTRNGDAKLNKEDPTGGEAKIKAAERRV